MLMYSWIGFSGASASRKRSWATMEAETDSSTAPLRQMMRSFFWRHNCKVSKPDKGAGFL